MKRPVDVFKYMEGTRVGRVVKDSEPFLAARSCQLVL